MDKKRSLLKISGTIGAAKHKEFEQTIRFVLNLLPPTCIASHLSQDVFRPDMYHVFTLWITSNDLARFKDSNEYQLIRGAFQALGFLDMALEGDLAEAQTFDIHNGH
jgi:hypothetical protein